MTVFQRLNHLANHPLFRLVFWGGLVFLATWLFTYFPLWKTLNSELEKAELLFLDSRLKFKQGFQAVDDRIVLVGKDRATDEFGRNHPEMGLTGGALPRERLADIVTFLSREGAKAIVLDVEFKNKTSDPVDSVLAQAIKNAGNVYLASDFYSPLHLPQDSSDKNKLLSQQTAQVILNKLYAHSLQWGLFTGHLTPVTALPIPTDYLFDFTQPQHPLNPIFGGYFQIIQQQAFSYVHQATPLFYASSLNPLKPLTQHFPNPTLETVFSENIKLCQHLMAEKFASQPDFLSQLDAFRLPVEKQLHEVSPLSLNMSRCYSEAFVLPILQSAKGIGVVSVDYSAEGFLREVPLLVQGYKGNLYGYLGLTPALDILKPEKITLTHEALEIKTLDDKLKTIPLNERGEILINWKHPRGDLQQRNGGNLYRQISAVDILKKMESEKPSSAELTPEVVRDLSETPSLYQIPRQPNSGPFSFKDKIVFYGDTVKDIHRTPVLEVMHGTEIVASVTDMILNDDVFFTHVDLRWVYWSIALLMLVIGIIIIQPQVNFVTANFCSAAIVFGYWLFNYQLFSNKALIMPLVIPTLLMMAAIFVADAYRYWVQDKEKRQLTNVFSNYVSPQVMAEILKSPDKAMDNLKGNKKELTVIFTDIKNFTNTFEHEDPEKMVEQLNEYFDVMIDIILKYDGTIDKFMGDAVMAFFGAPYPLVNNAEMACRAALEMQSALVELNQKWEVEGKKKLHHGIGVSTGQMFVGNFGSRNNKDFTVMGSMVNLGARLESSTRDLDADIIVSERTYELLRDLIEVKDLGKITVKGFSDPVAVYELKAFSQKRKSN
jgi:class 3 adenylate cyclase/CHASE2 domain-containing sensor protein